MTNETVVGKQIIDVSIAGEERDGNDHWVAAEIRVTIPSGAQKAARFSLELVTKRYYLDIELRQTMREIDNPETLIDQELAGDEAFETRPPYVLNDVELSEEIIKEKFIGRTVGVDLAASLWPLAD